jgi:hypothetical protein
LLPLLNVVLISASLSSSPEVFLVHFMTADHH